MATLQKFKLLATQCAVAASPTRSPTASPVIQLRRRKTLRMLLGRGGSGRGIPPGEETVDRGESHGESAAKGEEFGVRLKLKDLLVSSPPFEGRGSDRVGEDAGRSPDIPVSGGLAGRRVGPRSFRPLSTSLRQRLLRRAWRPVLVAIPE